MSKELDNIIENLKDVGLSKEMKIQRLINFDPYSTKVKMSMEQIDMEIRIIYDRYFELI